MATATDDFWKQLDVSDPLNQVIWEESVNVQLEIAPPKSLRTANAIGAQQAMIEGRNGDVSCLPWVPDLLMSDWKSQSAILIVGSAYAPFILEYSGKKGMPIAKYTEASEQQSVKLFIDSFRESVIPAWGYYNFTKDLITDLRADGKNLDGFALFDVCRASFVCRGEVTSLGFRADKGGDNIVRRQPSVFSDYVETKKPNEWLCKRIQRSNATRILALGTIAEHALLRCFARNLDCPSIRSEPDALEWGRNNRRAGQSWAKLYADGGHQLSYWQKDGWWEIQGRIDKSMRLWQLLPITHPSRSGAVTKWIIKRLVQMRYR
jgi:hypothetical protein